MSEFDVPLRKGKPESFGWLRRPELDRKGRPQCEAWETPTGAIIWIEPGLPEVRMTDTSRIKPSVHPPRRKPGEQPEAYRLKHAPKHFKLDPDQRHLKRGLLVTRFSGNDFGCASDDTAGTGQPHISVSVIPGQYPFFTMPLSGLEPVTLTPPDDEWTQKVCKIGQAAACCKYLCVGKGWCCAKLVPELRAQIDPRTDMSAKGDNCEGRGVDE